MTGREILVEIVFHGNSAKATALDPSTGVEASVVGPASAPQAALADAARRKLDFLLRKQNGGN